MHKCDACLTGQWLGMHSAVCECKQLAHLAGREEGIPEEPLGQRDEETGIIACGHSTQAAEEEHEAGQLRTGTPSIQEAVLAAHLPSW